MPNAPIWTAGDPAGENIIRHKKANDKQISGTHYKKLQPEPWDVVAAWDMDYFLGSAIKYLARWKEKGGVNDLKKAIHFIEKKIELEESTRTLF